MWRARAWRSSRARSPRSAASATRWPPSVKPEVLKRYGTIRMRRGLAVVSVRNGTCQGCNMNIPPQLYNTLQRGLSIETCPSCHRIIYWEDLMKDDVRRATDRLICSNPQRVPNLRVL